ncbi:MAG: DUF4430 domain-containing protein [Oscillospiraceae bacterium]|jgi:hypothetical protein|nr:DUF4430 domain-containing protein [Oscillospiraceae bacterium]
MKRRWGAEVAAALVVCALAVTFAIDNGRFAIGHVGTPPEAAETSAPSVEPSAGPPSAAAVNPESPPGETPEPSPAETGPWETPGAVPVTGEPPAETANAAETPAIQTPAPEPTTPTPTPPGESALTRTLSVRCDTLLGRLDALDPEKRELVPPDGVIFPAATVTFREGESVFNLLRRELRRAGVHLEFTGAPLYGSAYIEGIHNLYALDAGELSGWMYKVGGVFPSCGCSLCLLRDGDTVEWVYTCDLGRDVGAPSGGGQWGA